MQELTYSLPASTINKVIAHLSEQKYKDVAELIRLLLEARPTGEYTDG
jgi:hypothetical protein